MFTLPCFPGRPGIATEAECRKSPRGILALRNMLVECFSKKKPPTFIGVSCVRVTCLSGQAKYCPCVRNMPTAYFSKKKPPTFVGGSCVRVAWLSWQANVLSCRIKSVRWTLLGRKKPRSFDRGLCSRYLSSRAVTRQVLSAYMSLTSVFGMGTGGPS